MSWGNIIREIKDQGGEPDEIHCTPEDDTKEHSSYSDCWCNPEVAYEGNVPIYIHNALDGRDGWRH